MGVNERKEREKEARKNDILEAAKTVFFQRGFQATTMDQIAEAAELSKGSLYLYFSGKEELYISIFLDGLEILIKKFEKAVNGVEGWENKIRNIGSAYYRFYQKYQDYFRILFLVHHGGIISNVSESLYNMCFERGFSCLNFISNAVQEGIDAGEIAPHDQMELAVILWGAMNGIFLLYEDKEHQRFLTGSQDDLIRKSMEVMMEGLKKRGA